MECLGALEKFLHNDPVQTPLLIKAALSHVQFETIHPFLDGNGRLGRLVITLLFCAEGALEEPLLYLSLYLKKNRSQYYELLQKVRMEGAWEEWLLFFLGGFWKPLSKQRNQQRTFCNCLPSTGKKSKNWAVLQFQHSRCMLVCRKGSGGFDQESGSNAGSPRPRLSASLKALQSLNIVSEMTGRQRHQLFLYSGYFKILNEGTERL